MKNTRRNRPFRARSRSPRFLHSLCSPGRPPVPRGDAGMSTAEYAVGTIAAAGFAAVLYQVVTSGAVSGALQRLVEQALDAQL